MDILVAPDPHTAAHEAAAWVARQLRGAVSRRGEASVAFSGGSTPALMLAALVGLPVPWAATTVFQVDERVAPDGDPDRNARLLDALSPCGPTIRLMPVTAKDLDAARTQYASLLPDRFDVVHLGVGDDGHTASWPPGDKVIDASGAVAISGEYNGHIRMTLTVGVVNAARHRLVLATGAAKAPVIERWLLHDHALPIDRVNRAGTVLVLDADAAQRLPAGHTVPPAPRVRQPR
ncbi:MAG: glucose-6-phosphate isomerase [Ilumatobacteraceae bacterium]|jgi:6-phosphogluconolactonase/glucosamine-6-phosphate isomerase/deaminase|nr:glucose-6-phosphate isomerase [Ilumatobacteraceae bacterium]